MPNYDGIEMERVYNAVSKFSIYDLDRSLQRLEEEIYLTERDLEDCESRGDTKSVMYRNGLNILDQAYRKYNVTLYAIENYDLVKAELDRSSLNRYGGNRYSARPQSFGTRNLSVSRMVTGRRDNLNTNYTTNTNVRSLPRGGMSQTQQPVDVRQRVVTSTAGVRSFKQNTNDTRQTQEGDRMLQLVNGRRGSLVPFACDVNKPVNLGTDTDMVIGYLPEKLVPTADVKTSYKPDARFVAIDRDALTNDAGAFALARNSKVDPIKSMVEVIEVLADHYGLSNCQSDKERRQKLALEALVVNTFSDILFYSLGVVNSPLAKNSVFTKDEWSMIDEAIDGNSQHLPSLADLKFFNVALQESNFIVYYTEQGRKVADLRKYIALYIMRNYVLIDGVFKKSVYKMTVDVDKTYKILNFLNLQKNFSKFILTKEVNPSLYNIIEDIFVNYLDDIKDFYIKNVKHTPTISVTFKDVLGYEYTLIVNKIFIPSKIPGSRNDEEMVYFLRTSSEGVVMNGDVFEVNEDTKLEDKPSDATDDKKEGVEDGNQQES